MKKILSILLLGLCAVTGRAQTNFFDIIQGTNIYIAPIGGWGTAIHPGNIVISRPLSPFIEFDQIGSAAPPFPTPGTAGLYYGGSVPHSFLFTDTVNVNGNIVATGYVIGSTNILWQTNNVILATNAIHAALDYAGNPLASIAYVLTNTSLAGPLTISEGGGFVWTIDAGTLIYNNGSPFNGSIQFLASGSFVLGDAGNAIVPYATDAVIGGGFQNNMTATLPFPGGTSVDYSTIAGGNGNKIVDSIECTISGGGGNTSSNCMNGTIGGGGGNYVNTIASATISGGFGNVAGSSGKLPSASGPTVSGGNRNQALDDATTVSGGEQNVANGSAAVIAGGYNNAVTGYGSLVSGGTYNACLKNNPALGYSAVLGGAFNTNFGGYSTILGGFQNYISDAANYSIVGGLNASNTHASSFVWSDGTLPSYDASSMNSFQVYAAYGLKLDGGPFRGNGIVLTNKLAAPTPAANQCILWYSNTVLWATGPNSTKPVLQGL